MAYPYMIQGDNVVVVIDNKPHTVSKSHISYTRLVEAIKAQDWDAVKDVVEPKKVILDFGQGNVSIKGETMYWRGQEFHNSLSKRMIQMLQEGFSIEPLVMFMENLKDNPSKTSVEELYGFLEKNSLPITPDGHFLAYKKVREDYKDIHSGTFDNSVGAVCEMERNEVDDNRDRTCSTGLHFCSKDYLPYFGIRSGAGNHVMIVKINPKDVVSIPSDYDNSKGRTARYEVVGELDVSADEAFTRSVQGNANTIPDDFDLDDEYDIWDGDDWEDDNSDWEDDSTDDSSSW